METSQQSPTPTNPDVRIEARDVHYRPLAAAAIALAFLVALALLVSAWLFGWLAAEADRIPATSDRPQAVHELQQLRAREDERLDSYGWVSRQEGIVHIPIERAMEWVVERNSNKRHPND